MSKIFAKNLATETVRAFWRRSGELVTAFADKYRHDQFFSTQVHVVAVQVAFALILILIVSLAFNELTDEFVSTFVHTSFVPDSMIAQFESLRFKSLLAVIAVVAFCTGITAAIAAKFTLTPTRVALEAQKQFIANVAHELRTPLAIIKANTEIAQMSTRDASLNEGFKSNVEELDRISSIINNLLSLSSLVRPERMEFGNVDIGTVIENVMRSAGKIISQKNIEVSIRKSEFRLVWGNSSALEQIVMNVVKNAVTHTPKGGRIHVTIEPDYARNIEIIIQDSGPGIPRKDLFHIFEPFYRTDYSRHRAKGGTGLGLSIVNELVKLHHGKIAIRSSPERGTTVVIALPCGKRVRYDERTGLVDEISLDFSLVQHKHLEPAV